MCVLSFDDGMLAESWYAEFALRIRVRKSAIGSVILMSGGASLAAVPHALGPRRLGARASRRSVLLRWGVLPGTLADAGQLAGVCHLPQADPAQAELAEDGVGAAAALAAGVAADRELRLAGRLVDESLLGHLCFSPAPAQRVVFTTVWPAKGNPSRRSSSRPSSSVVAVVTSVMSMPRGRSILSTSISRNIDCSVSPKV